MGAATDKTLVPCEGGPCTGYGLLVAFPPPFEIERDRHGVYVLDDTGDEHRYVYVPNRP